MKAKKRVMEAIRERCTTDLVEALERGVRSWPLPSPPRIDPEFPPSHPKEPSELVAKAHGLFQADRGNFDRSLMETVELVVPHRMSLTEDPFEQHEKWLMRRQGLVSERILFSTCTVWLSQALDEHSPDSMRWWFAFALLDGLCSSNIGQPVHQGYHLLESIALCQRPGTWHTQPDAGPHMMEWNPNSVTPRTDIVAHDDGCASAMELLRRLEEGDETRRLLLVEWMRLLLERKELIEPLDVPAILLRRTADPSDEVASGVVRCLARFVEADGEAGRKALEKLHDRDSSKVNRALADVLTRMFRRIEWDAVPYLEDMLNSDDENVLAAASATVGDLRFLDEEKFADTVSNLVDHPLAIVRRNLVPHLREYIRMYPDDDREVLSRLWIDGDEVVETRLRELLLRLEDVDPSAFSRLLHRLQGSSDTALDRLWTVMEVRSQENVESWKRHLDGGPAPAVTVQQEVTVRFPSNIEVELPELSDALSVLDGEE